MRSSRFFLSCIRPGVAHGLRRPGIAVGPRSEDALDRHLKLVAQQPEHVGRSGRNQRRGFMPPVSRSRARRQRVAVAGIVMSQARPIWRTSAQCTWCQRRLPAPIPDDRGGDHLGRRYRPHDEAPKITQRTRSGWRDPRPPGCGRCGAHGANDPPSAERRAGGERRSANPASSMSEPPTCRSARPRAVAAITPTDFCASFAPWLNAKVADIPHSPAGPVPSAASRAGRAGGRRGWPAVPPARRAGRIASAISVPKTPTGSQPSSPPQLTAWIPPSPRGSRPRGRR